MRKDPATKEDLLRMMEVIDRGIFVINAMSVFTKTVSEASEKDLRESEGKYIEVRDSFEKDMLKEEK